jgi:hypothetical protein
MITSYLLSDKPLIFDDVPKELAELYPVEKTLQILHFDNKNNFGLPMRTWGRLEVTASPWLENWLLMFSTHWRDERTIPIPYQIPIPVQERPIIILSLIYEAWDSWFRWMETPGDLQMAKEFSKRNWEEGQREYLSRPTLWADREFFRFCVSYLEKNIDWPEEDLQVELSYTDGQLRMRVRELEVHCPAKGKFNGTLALSSRKFFRSLSKRLRGSSVFIQVVDEEKAIIGSRQFRAQFRSPERTTPEG